jgi:hypothetical protein
MMLIALVGAWVCGVTVFSLGRLFEQMTKADRQVVAFWCGIGARALVAVGLGLAMLAERGAMSADPGKSCLGCRQGDGRVGYFPHVRWCLELSAPDAMVSASRARAEGSEPIFGHEACGPEARFFTAREFV